MRYITMDEFLMNRITLAELTPELLGNANTTVPAANELLDRFGEFRGCNSGYRSPEDQMRINPSAPKSKHMLCAAIDLEDKDNKLKTWCLANLQVLEELGLYMEHPNSTPTWIHVQIVAPHSGNRVFKP